jgi:hypothetical protein
MPFKDLIDSIKNFVKSNWKEILGAIGTIGNVIIFIISKLEHLPSAYWLALAFLFWLFILLSAAFSVKSASPVVRALAIIGIFSGTAGVAYFGTVASIYFFTEAPSAVGEIFKRDKSAASLKASGFTDQTLIEEYRLAFSEPADYVETDFTVGSQQHIVKKLLMTYEDLPEYQGKVKKSDTTIGIANVVPGFSVDIFLFALLNQKTQNAEINVSVEKKFAKRNRYWRLKRWVFERYQD